MSFLLLEVDEPFERTEVLTVLSLHSTVKNIQYFSFCAKRTI
ncbi:hypothetical protein BACI348_140035 [Bacillus altitudinis]|uniref:Uncharacterized protein n=1 Tax=Bacillus altitudinis TaxID=293387 RepID=A0A653LMT3_BACAB|nr:hypothetical protein BACI348_140035 [Bacillus altitudinis]